MQLSTFTLTALVAPFLAMTIMNNAVLAAPPNGLARSTCQRACLQSPTETCAGYDAWPLVGKSEVTLKQIPQDVYPKVGSPSHKKEWYLEPIEIWRPNWIGGHISEDGSMSQWIIAGDKDPNEKDKNYLIKYLHKDYAVFYWQKGQELCTAPANTFGNFESLVSVAVLTNP